MVGPITPLISDSVQSGNTGGRGECRWTNNDSTIYSAELEPKMFKFIQLHLVKIMLMPIIVLLIN